MDVYASFDVSPVINAAGDFTKFGGSIIADEVRDAMIDASKRCVKIDELQGAASLLIAEATGSEAGHVTSGAAAGIVLACGACHVNTDSTLMRSIPNIRDSRKRFVALQRSHLSRYARMFELAGGTLFLFDDASELEELLARDVTIAVGFVHERAQFGMDVQEIVDRAHRRSVPVVVDAANALPPLASVRRYIDMNVDLVVVSGGKALRGPQASGFVCGSSELVKIVSQLHLDGGVTDQDGQRSAHGLGRPMKVGKEEIIGLMVALKQFMGRDHDEEYKRWSRQMYELSEVLCDVEGLKVCYEARLPNGRLVPCVVLEMSNPTSGYTAKNLLESLEEGTRRVVVNDSLLSKGSLVVNPVNLYPGEVDVVAQRIKEEMVRERSF